MTLIRALVCILAASTACARSIPIAATGEGDVTTSAVTPTEPHVEVRDLSFAPTLAVVAWYQDDAAYGIRTTFRRGASLVRYHQFFVSTRLPVSFQTGPGYVPTLVPPNKALKVLGVAGDPHYCFSNKETCSPPQSIRIRVPDELLRANRDSISLRLFHHNRDLVLTLRRDLVDGYLRVVDSVSRSQAER